MVLYKFGSYLFKKKIPILPKIFNVLIRLIHNCAIFSECNIGKNTILAYGGIGVVIHKRAVIGENCIIGSNVTIGGKSQSVNVPIIGDNSFIASGAKILGDVKVLFVKVCVPVRVTSPSAPRGTSITPVLVATPSR